MPNCPIVYFLAFDDVIEAPLEYECGRRKRRDKSTLEEEEESDNRRV